MLILRRKVGDSLMIGDNITLTVLSVDASGNINLGIDAPKDVVILRKELEQVKQTNVESAQVPAHKTIEALNKVLPAFSTNSDASKPIKPIAPNSKQKK